MTVLRVIDFETNGFAPPAEVLELGVCDLTASPEGEWTVGLPRSELFSIGAPLDPQARATHHIRPEEIADKPPYLPSAAIARNVDALVAHNWSFEGQWLTEAVLGAVHVLCTYKASLRVWPDAPSHSNGALRYWLEDQGLIAPAWSITQPAHRAGPDAYVTAWILKALLTRVTGREMIAWTKEPPLLPTCPIGEKWRGKKWSEVDGGFLTWMLRQQDMDAGLKWNARRELDRRIA
jgi:exodeoxyribonuclease X